MFFLAKKLWLFIVNVEWHFVTDVMCYITSASHRWWLCNKPLHAEIIYEQNASKIVKISQQRAKFCQK